jgi:lipopolysaccharide heptosyltransferase I
LTSSSADLRSRDFRKILLIKLSAVGDVIHTIPVLNKLRRRYPAAQLDWLVTPPIAELLRHNPAITNVIEFAREDWSKPWTLTPFASYARLAAKLRANAYDLVVDMHGQVRTAVFTLATGAPVRIGFDRPRARVWDASSRTFSAEARKHAWQGAREGSWLAYTHHIPVPTLDLHAVDRYLSVGPILGLEEGPPNFSFPVPQAAIARVESLLRQHDIAGAQLVAMAPGTIWETKHWGTDKFSEVARHFLQKGFAVALMGTRRERVVCEEVARLAPGAVDVAGETTLTELAALVRRSAISVTNDSGPMHLAVALDRPVVSVFGPTDPIWIGPYGRTDAVLRAGVPCSPCFLRQLSRCRYDHV